MAEKWEKILEEAKACLQKDDFDGAIRLCNEIINSPENEIPREARALAFGIRGAAYKEKGEIDRATSDFDHAISGYDEVIKRNPKNAVALYNRGNVYQEKGDFDRAISDYDESIKIDSKDALAFYNRGNVYQEKGEIDRAIADYNKATKLDPKFTEAFHNRALAHGRRDAQASEKKYREEYERGLQKLREQSKQETKKLREELRQTSEQSEQDAQKLHGELRQASEQSEQDAEKLRKQFRQASEQSEQNAEKLREQLRQVREQFRQVSDPAEIIKLYKERDIEYKARVLELEKTIKASAKSLRNRLSGGFVCIVAFVVWLIFEFKFDSFNLTLSFTLASLTLAWLAAHYPESTRLNDMRKEKHKKEICVEDYFRKLTLVLYTLASEGDERKKMMAVTHAHFATRSTAEFLADWNPPSDDKSHPLFDFIAKIFRRKDDDSSPKPPETKPPA